MVHQQAAASEYQVIAELESGQRLERTAAPDRRKRESAEQSDSGAFLAGLIFDDTGRPLRPIRVNQGARGYPFYMSHALQQREEAAGLSPACAPASKSETSRYRDPNRVQGDSTPQPRRPAVLKRSARSRRCRPRHPRAAANCWAVKATG
jgi:hypothetical protein